MPMMRGDVHTAASSSFEYNPHPHHHHYHDFDDNHHDYDDDHHDYDDDHHNDITRATRQRLCLQEPTQPKNETKRTSLQ